MRVRCGLTDVAPQHSAGRRRPGGAALGERVSRWLLPGTCSPVPLDCELLEDEGFAFHFGVRWSSS